MIEMMASTASNEKLDCTDIRCLLFRGLVQEVRELNQGWSILWQWRDISLQLSPLYCQIRMGGHESRPLRADILPADVHVGHEQLILGGRRRQHRSVHWREPIEWGDEPVRDVQQRAPHLLQQHLLRRVRGRSDRLLLMATFSPDLTTHQCF